MKGRVANVRIMKWTLLRASAVVSVLFLATPLAAESLSPEQPSPSEMARELGVTFGYPRINGKKAPLVRATAHYNPGSSPACATARVDGESVVVEVGPLFHRDKERGHHPLNLAITQQGESV